MAHITRCPRCHTAFKVHPDQLQAASGQVRCGHCGHVFDALVHILGTDAETAGTVSADTRATDSAPPARPVPVVPVWPTLFGEPLEKLHDAPAEPGTLHAPTGASEAVSTAPASAAERGSVPAGTTPLPRPGTFTPEETPAGAPATPRSAPAASLRPDSLGMEPRFEPAGAPAFDADAPATDHDGGAPYPHSLRFDAPQAAPTDRADALGGGARGPLAHGVSALDGSALAPGIDASSLSSGIERLRASPSADPAPARTGWIVLAALLVLLLIGQGMLWQRSWIAARWPVTAPALRLLCAPLRCDVAPYQQLSAITIVDSNFKATAPSTGAYELELTLHNRATLTVGVPSFELTLTGNDGQVLVRRVLTPGDLGAPPVLAASATVPMARRLQITTQPATGPVANYRLTAFYP